VETIDLGQCPVVVKDEASLEAAAQWAQAAALAHFGVQGVQAAEVVPLFGGADERCETLLQALRALIYERGAGMPVPSILGVLRILEHELLREQT
jgi:hypothetical protein